MTDPKTRAGVALALLALAILGPGGVLFSSTVLAQDSRPSEPIAVRLDLQLIDRTGMIEANPQHGSGAEAEMEDHLLANADVELTSFTPDADEVVTQGKTDAEGRVVLDLGMRIPGSPYKVRATTADGGVFHAKPAGLAPAGGQLLLYRAGRDASTVRQLVMRVVTVALGGDDPESDTVNLQVRQIVSYQNGGFEAYEGPESAGGAGFLFPVPRDAEVLELKLGSESALDIEARDVPGWGHGVPIQQPLFPLESGYAMGIYTQTVKRGGTIDLGFSAIVDTQALQLALETGKLFHDEAAVEKDGTLLSKGDSQMMPDVGRSVDFYTSDPIPAGHSIQVSVRYGPPGVSMHTVVMILLIAACFAFPVFGGMAIARRRTGTPGVQNRRAELDRLRDGGELTEHDYQRELSRLEAAATPVPVSAAPMSAAPVAATALASSEPPVVPEPAPPSKSRPVPPEILERLDAIAGRTELDEEQTAKDMRELARILRDQLREGTR